MSPRDAAAFASLDEEVLYAVSAGRRWGLSGVDDALLVTHPTPWSEISRQFMVKQDLSAGGGSGGGGGGSMPSTPLPRQGSGEQDWEEAERQETRGDVAIRRSSSVAYSEIVAPSFRLLPLPGSGSDGESGYDGESSGEEDISDEAYLSRHAEHLNSMREKLEAARKAREALASPRPLPKASKKSLKSSSWDQKGHQPLPSPPTPLEHQHSAASNGWAFAIAAAGNNGHAAEEGFLASPGFAIPLPSPAPPPDGLHAGKSSDGAAAGLPGATAMVVLPTGAAGLPGGPEANASGAITTTKRPIGRPPRKNSLAPLEVGTMVMPSGSNGEGRAKRAAAGEGNG
ncbi:unnamed protein product [Phaeothamnion confervicola]